MPIKWSSKCSNFWPFRIEIMRNDYAFLCYFTQCFSIWNCLKCDFDQFDGSVLQISFIQSVAILQYSWLLFIEYGLNLTSVGFSSLHQSGGQFNHRIIVSTRKLTKFIGPEKNRHTLEIQLKHFWQCEFIF